MTDFLKNNIMYMIAILSALVWAFITIVIVMAAINKSAQADMANLLAVYTTVTGVFASIYSYWYGSTKASKDKDDTIKQLTSNQ
jgi:hypothetical protein